MHPVDKFIQIDLPLPFTSTLPIKTYVVVDWPLQVIHKDETYYQTGKVGTRRSDNTPSAEYKGSCDKRVWLDAVDGTVTED